MTFEGYTDSTTTGDLDGMKGANYGDIRLLGTTYTWAEDAWVMDAIAGYLHRGTTTASQVVARDGRSSISGVPAGAPCSGWTTTSSSSIGPVLNTTQGTIDFSKCDKTFKLACVSGG